MLKYEYENATVYITKPNEKHIENIKKATEIFMKKVIKEEIQNGVEKTNESRRNNRRISRHNSYARQRDKET